MSRQCKVVFCCCPCLCACPWVDAKRCDWAVQVEALQAQMEEQARLAKEQVESLLDDRRLQADEGQVQHQRDQERITDLTNKCV